MARKKKDCTARQCSNRIKAAHYFCESCMARVPRDLRSRFLDAYKIGAGRGVLDLSTEIREFLDTRPQPQPQKEKEQMTTGKSDLIEISAEYRMEKGGGMAIWTGDYVKNQEGEDVIDDQGNKRENWIWLPKSQVDRTEEKVFTLPYWLAKEKGLI